MEDVQELLIPPVKERMRLLLAMTIYWIKPPHITLEDYLTHLRLQVYSTQKTSQVDLGDYTPLKETDDLRGLVGILMRRVEGLEWEKERESKRQRVMVKQEEIESMKRDMRMTSRCMGWQ